MGKSPTFDDVLAAISDVEDRKAIETVASKYPELKAGWLRQSDYSRKLDENRKKLEFADEWANWYRDNWVVDEQGNSLGTKTEVELRKQLDALMAERKGNDMTFSEIDKYLAEKGFVDKDVLAKEAAGFQQSILEEMKKALQQQQQMMAHIGVLAPKLATAVLRHEKEFGELLDTNKLIEFANERGLSDPDVAYEQFVAEKREAKRVAEWEAKVAAAKAEGRAEAMKEAGMNPMAMPDDHTGTQMSALQRLVMNQQAGVGEVDADKIPFSTSGNIGKWAAYNNWQPPKTAGE